jgi:hypothetical protein
MSGLLARAAALVVELRSPHELLAAPAAPGAPRVLVLGGAAVAPPLAAALAGTLRARERAPATLVCVWAPATSAPSAAPPAAAGTRAVSLWASAGARRLAARLVARGLDARAAGRLAWLTLPPEAGAAAEALGRLVGWLDAPIVTALAGPRAPAFDALAAEHDVFVAVRPAAGPGMSSAARDALASLALSGLGGVTVACDPLPAGVASWRARAGLARLPAGHAALDGLDRGGVQA